jgi:cyclopropane-fatty-acyl-phospholipid synthase
MAWHRNFVDAWPDLSGHYDERFFRMWSYYLLSCAGAFRAGKGQLWQIVFSPHGLTPETLARRREADPRHQPAVVNVNTIP